MKNPKPPLPFSLFAVDCRHDILHQVENGPADSTCFRFGCANRSGHWPKDGFKTHTSDICFIKHVFTLNFQQLPRAVLKLLLLLSLKCEILMVMVDISHYKRLQEKRAFSSE